MRPSVEAMPTRATDQKSATISEIQRSQSCQARPAAPAPRCSRAQHRAQRIDEIKQRRRLMPDLVNQRRRDAGPDHALARNTDDRHRVLAAAGHARARAPDGSTDVAIEIADDRWRVIVAGQRQRIGGDDIEAGQPHARLVLAALRDDVGEHVELGQHGIEPEAQDRETALCFLGGRLVAFAAEPGEIAPDHAPELAPAGEQEAVDRHLRGGKQRGGRQHRLLQRERLDQRESRQQRARFVQQHRSCEGADRHDTLPYTPYITIVLP